MYMNQIHQLSLPEPKQGETQTYYIKRLLLNGYRINTRQCQFIGILNLHSRVSALKKARFPLTIEHKQVVDPATGKTPPYAVDVVYMTADQIHAYKRENASGNKTQGA